MTERSDPPGHWGLVWDLFHRALETGSEERAAFLTEACGGDKELRSEVEKLLAAHEHESQLLDLLTELAPEGDTSRPTELPEVPPEQELAPGAVLADRFEIVGLVGRGGMGAVYEAQDRELGARVALKTLLAALSGSSAALDRFRREIQLAKQVTHPNVCRIYDLFRDREGLFFLSMELLEGKTLAQHIAESGPLDLDEALPIVEQLAAGLAAAHQAGVVHRDLKSSNIMLIPEGGGTRAVVTDFGLARTTGSADAETGHLTRSGEVLGTPAFMAPEQLEGGEISPATDVYAFGVVLFEMVTGRLPFSGVTPYAVVAQRLRNEPPSPREHSPNLDRRWERVILRCLESRPADRFQTPGAIVAALLGAKATTIPSDRRRLARRSAVAAMGMAVVFGGFFLLRGDADSDAAASAEADQDSSAALPFAERDAVLITAFENRTGDEIFDGTLEGALARQLANSTFVTVATLPRIRDTLALMGLPDNAEVDTSTGREIALRDGGIRALIGGRIEKLGQTWVLSADLIDASDGRVVASLEEEAPHMEEVLGAIRRLASGMRELLGEEIDEIRESEEELARVATPSLRALRLYTEADALVARIDNAASEELLRQAIELDPDFASAHILLAYAIGNQGRPQEELFPHAERAFELAGQAPERERYFIRASYFQMSGEWEKARANYEALLRVDPYHFWGNSNMARSLSRGPRREDAPAYWVRRARGRPNDLDANFDAGYALEMIAESPEAARPYLRRVVDLAVDPNSPLQQRNGFEISWARLHPAHEHWVGNDAEGMLRELDRVAEELSQLSPGLEAAFLSAVLRSGYRSLGFRNRPPALRPISRTGSFWGGIDAYYRGDLAEVKRQLGEARSRLVWAGALIQEPPRILALVRAGFLAEARAGLASFELREETSVPDGYPARNTVTDVMKGHVALAEGRVQEALALLQSALTAGPEPGGTSYFVAASGLASAWLELGEPARALAALEESSRQKRRSHPYARETWMANQLRLASLYRELGRASDAQGVEDELRAMLAYADPDFWLVQQLAANSQPAP